MIGKVKINPVKYKIEKFNEIDLNKLQKYSKV